MRLKLTLPSLSKTKLTTQELISLYDSLSLMLNAGIPILTALNTIQSTTKHKIIIKVCRQLNHALTQGFTLTKAVKHTKAFTEVDCAILASGERSGNLPKNFAFLATYYNQQLELTRLIQRSLIYPCILLITGITSMCLLTFVFIPKLYTTLPTLTLPYATQLLINSTIYIQHHAVLIIASIFLLITLTIRLYNHSSLFKLYLAKHSLKIPLLKDLIYNFNMTRFFYVLAITCSTGIPLLTALTLGTHTCSNPYLRNQLQQISLKLNDGASIYQAFTYPNIFPSFLTQMLLVGETSGALDTVLTKAANQLNHNLQLQLKLLANLAEPIFMLIISLILGFIIYAMYIPIFNLSNAF